MTKLNLPNKITVGRIILAVLILIILIMPWYQIGINWPTYLIGNVSLNLKYIVVCLFFIAASLSDFLDGYLAR